MKFTALTATIGLSLLASQPATAAEVRVFVTGAARAAFEEIAPRR
jgi:ABC-type molybdate transport system substrate-binding protein